MTDLSAREIANKYDLESFGVMDCVGARFGFKAVIPPHEAQIVLDALTGQFKDAGKECSGALRVIVPQMVITLSDTPDPDAALGKTFAAHLNGERPFEVKTMEGCPRVEIVISPADGGGMDEAFRAVRKGAVATLRGEPAFA